MYRVIEVAKALGVSKVTVYKKMELFKKELKPHIQKKKNITYLDEEAFEIIRQSLVDNGVIEDDAQSKEQLMVMEEKLARKEMRIDALYGSIQELCDEHAVDLEQINDMLQGQLSIKMKELDEKKKMMESYKALIQANKNRIDYLETLINYL